MAQREWVDRLVGSDPGLTRLRNALMSVFTIGVILLAEAWFVHFSHALQIQTHGATLPAAAAAQVATANHEFLVIGMLLGAIVGMISCFAVMDPTAKGQLITMVLLPIPMVGALALGIALGGHRVVALASLVVMLSVGTYLRRFGPRGFVGGILLFLGDFFGFFLHGAVTMSDLGWLTAEIGVGLVVAIAVRFTLFYPHPARALARIERSYGARARKVLRLALAIFEDPDHGDRQARQLHQQLVRLNEAALMIDAQLGDASAVADGSSGQLLHQRLFDIELALTNVARFAPVMGRLDLPADQRQQIREGLSAMSNGDTDGAKAHGIALIDSLSSTAFSGGEADRTAVVVTHRFAESIIDLAEIRAGWTSLGRTGDGEGDGGKGSFQPSVVLFGGWLPGSAQVSAAASMERGGRHLADRVTLAPYTRTAIQMGVAVAVAITLGDLRSGRRFYWAVIAAFITFMGANNSGEQARKAILRVVGTVVGIVIGSLLAHAVGHHSYWSITVILVSIFFAFYLMRINYAFMVIGITVMVSQLYVQLGEFSNSLLLLRLEETTIGAAVAIAVVMLVLPLRTRQVLGVAMRAHVQALSKLLDHATGELLGDEPAGESTLRADARALDATYQALVATIQPLRRNLFGHVDDLVGSAVQLASASRHYARNLVADVEAVGALDAETILDLRRGSETLRQSLEVVAAAFGRPRTGTYTRSASQFDQAERRLEGSTGMIDSGQLALRDLKLIDGTMARLAEAMQLAVTDYDTVDVTPSGASRPA
jgi:uncharacterized membrane protein YgaE (UPF0421/DUF939 family)